MRGRGDPGESESTGRRLASATVKRKGTLQRDSESFLAPCTVGCFHRECRCIKGPEAMRFLRGYCRNTDARRLFEALPKKDGHPDSRDYLMVLDSLIKCKRFASPPRSGGN